MEQKAWLVERPGGDFRQAEFPLPKPGMNQVLVRISASGVNPLDTKIRAGKAAHARQPLPALVGLANLYNIKGDYSRAEPLYHRVLSIREKALGPKHPEIAAPLINLGVIYRVKGDYTKAELYQLRALAIREKALGVEHPDVASALQYLAALYAEKGDNVQAIAFQSRALEIYERNITDNLGSGSERQKLAY